MNILLESETDLDRMSAVELSGDGDDQDGGDSRRVGDQATCTSPEDRKRQDFQSLNFADIGVSLGGRAFDYGSKGARFKSHE